MIYNCYEKNNVINLVYTKDGKMFTESSAFTPSLYFPSNDSNVRLKSMFGKPLKRKMYKNITEYTINLYNLKNKKEEFYGDINPIYQFIINKFLYKKIEVDDHIKIYNYDIEAFFLNTDEFSKPEEAKAPIQTITIQEYHTDKYYIFGYKDFEVKDLEIKDDDGKLIKVVPKERVVYTKFRTEVELLRNFIKFLKVKSVQVITGWNILQYDNLYVYNRLRKLGIEKDFVDECKEYHGGVTFPYMQNLDYMEIDKKLEGEPQPSHSLNYRSKTVNNVSKKEIDGFRKTYIEDFQKFVEYNIHDVTCVGLMEDTLQFITLMFSMASNFRCLPEDILHVTRYWNSYIFSYALENNIIVNASEDRPKIPYVGGYVYQPKLGLDDWGVMYDIESSYPRAIRAYNISPETIVSYHDLPDDLYNETTNHLFSIMKKVYDENKNIYRTESGSKSTIFGVNTNPKKYNVLALNNQFADNNGLPDRIQYPHFVLYETKEDVEESTRCRKIEHNKYLYLADSKSDLIQSANVKFKNHDKIVIIDHVYLTLGLIEYFKEDHNRFKSFEKGIKRENFIITPNLQFFKKTDDALLPTTVEKVFIERVAAKNREKFDLSIALIAKEYIDNNFYITDEKIVAYGIKQLPEAERKELIGILKTKDKTKIQEHREKYLAQKVIDSIENRSKKIAINGVYGATGNEGFRFNDIRLCESITSCAQLALRGTARYLELLNLWVTLYGDTDSVLSRLLNIKIGETDEITYNNIIKELEEHVEPAIKNYDREVTDICNLRNVSLKFEREAVVKRSLFTGKKHYFWWVYESDGKIYKDKPKYKTRGLDTRKSDTPVWVAKLLDSFLIKVINNTDSSTLIKYVKAAKKHFMGLKFADIAKSTGADKLKEYNNEMKSNLLPHYKGAITYNKWLKENDKSKKYEQIKNGKVKWCYVKENKYGTNALSLPEEYPPEILNDFQIDYEAQFEATVMGLVNQVFDSCNWSFDDRQRLI